MSNHDFKKSLNLKKVLFRATRSLAAKRETGQTHFTITQSPLWLIISCNSYPLLFLCTFMPSRTLVKTCLEQPWRCLSMACAKKYPSSSIEVASSIAQGSHLHTEITEHHRHLLYLAVVQVKSPQLARVSTRRVSNTSTSSRGTLEMHLLS